MLPYQIHEPTLPSVIHHPQRSNSTMGESTAFSSVSHDYENGDVPQGKAIYAYVPVRSN